METFLLILSTGHLTSEWNEEQHNGKQTVSKNLLPQRSTSKPLIHNVCVA